MPTIDFHSISTFITRIEGITDSEFGYITRARISGALYELLDSTPPKPDIQSALDSAKESLTSLHVLLFDFYDCKLELGSHLYPDLASAKAALADTGDKACARIARLTIVE